MLSLSSSRLETLLARFRADKRGVSAVEFALLLPLMLTLYFGSVEISQGVTIDRKVTLTTRALADLVSQVAKLSSTDMTNVLDATVAVMTPFSTTPLKVTVSSVKIDNNGIAKVAWSATRNGTARTVNSTVTLPTALVTNNTSLIWAEVSYAYKPTIGYVISGTLTLADQIYMRPRLSDNVEYPVS